MRKLITRAYDFVDANFDLVFTLTIVVALVVMFLIFASPAPGGETKPNHLAEIRLADGSLVRVSLLQESIDVQTAYGKLTVPVREIRRIEFGLHLSDKDAAAVASGIKRLGSEVHKDRDAAMRNLLDMGHRAAPALRHASKSLDKETVSRATALLKQLTERVPSDMLTLPEVDTIVADFTIVGTVASPELQAASPHFGTLGLKLPDIRSIHILHGATAREMTIDAAKEDWLDTGINVSPNVRLNVVAEGSVDLWPQGPGQFMAQPRGWNGSGKNNQFMAGSLLGKIGSGNIFFIGDRCEATPAGDGRLYLQINPSPWNCASSGSYRVRIRMDAPASSLR